MEARSRVLSTISQQENLMVNKNKSQTLLKGGVQNGQIKRAVLGDISSNIRIEKEVGKGKPQSMMPDLDKTNANNRRPITRSLSYKNVTAKVDSRLPVNVTGAKAIKICKDVPKKTTDENLSAKYLSARLKETTISSKPIDRKSDEKYQSDNSVKSSISSKSEVKTDNLNIIFKGDDKSVKPSRRSAYSTELLHVEDIDNCDGKSPILIGYYIKDIYNYLMDLEVRYPIRENHLSEQACVTPRMRALLIDWLVEVHLQFALMLETLHLTVAIIDRYLQTVKDIQRAHIQLVGISAMFIACKYEEMFVPEIHDFIHVTDNTYTKTQILRCEKEILSKLDFSLGRPLPLHFERRFIKAAGVESRSHHLAKYFIDLCLIEYDMAHYKPSQIAAAAVSLSISILSPFMMPEKCWSMTLVYYTGYKYKEIANIVRKIAIIALNAEKSNYKAVIKKYNMAKHGKVPSYPELRGSLIERIASADLP